ncbi:DUF3048 domain-containing protein [Streptomyces sp. DSM 42041]|uniref:DUF3048 domain-containing protein n=1 Tax=Streptomyces hazeniae TaxID=3075538 RepID=A0ABU2NXP5_9ACTN|nr:DUF3048 domain-containing protein [Streptomyces sp. DSM 42041]MDT0381766.1 DUF3048 domain-containing protein [Streptomyces sp. DSM 42041]
MGTLARDDIRPRRRRQRARRRTVPAGVLVLALAAAACTGQNGDEDPPSTPTPQPTAQPPTGTPETPDAPAVSPFTGEEGKPHGVLAVKLGNTPSARPHTGLRAADLVYVEKVEGGLSRLMAVYASRTPDRVGPVRSARESDLELLRQFGHPAFAYSGVRSALKDDLRKSPVRRVPAGESPNAYTRSSGRAVPDNLYVRPKAALRTAEDPSRPRDIGFRFGPAPDGGTKDGSHTVRYPAARFGFTWSAEQERWLVSMDGAPARGTDGDRLGAPTVVVQYVTMRPSRFRDVAGAVTPYIESVGSGRAKVLRDGRAYDVRWKRPSAADGTAFTLPGGARMPFDRGQVWIVYAER